MTAWAFVVIGLFNFVFFMTANILEIIEDTEDYSKLHPGKND